MRRISEPTRVHGLSHIRERSLVREPSLVHAPSLVRAPTRRIGLLARTATGALASNVPIRETASHVATGAIVSERRARNRTAIH